MGTARPTPGTVSGVGVFHEAGPLWQNGPEQEGLLVDLSQQKPKQTLHLTRLERDALSRIRDEIAKHEAMAQALRQDLVNHTNESAERFGIEPGTPVTFSSDLTKLLIFERPPAPPGKPTPEPGKADAPPKNEAPKNGQHVHPPEPAKT